MLGIALAIPNPCDNKGMRSEYEFKKKQTDLFVSNDTHF